MNGIDIIDIKEKNIKGAYVIDGFPSVGLVGSIVANYLVSFLKLEQIAMVDSIYFPTISLIRDELPLSPVRVYAGAFGNRGQEKIVVFVSEFQPAQEILKPLAITMMDWAEDHKCKMMISPEGLLTREESERIEAMARASQNLELAAYEGPVLTPKKDAQNGTMTVYGVASTASARQMLKQNGIKPFENGVISGLAGVLLNEGVARDFDVTTLLSEAHTPFGWLAQKPLIYFEQAKQLILDEKRKLHAKMVQFKFHDIEHSVLESAIGRGDRRLCDVIEEAWKNGAKFDLWDECFNPAIWQTAFEKFGFDLYQLAARKFEPDEILPWEHLGGPEKKYLLTHLNKAMKKAESEKL